MRRGPKRRPEARASSASCPRLFDAPCRADQAGGRSPAPDRLPERRIAKEIGDLGKHLEVDAGRRTDEEEQCEDRLTVWRLEIDGLPQKEEREGRLARRKGDWIPHVGDRDSVANRHDGRGIAGKENVE